jgi:hypothetical protein
MVADSAAGKKLLATALSVLKVNIRDARAAGKAGIRHPLCRAPPGTGTLIDTAPFPDARCWRIRLVRSMAPHC